MKNINIKILGILTFLFILAGCEREGIDPITNVEPGQDEGAPEINIKYPQQGTVIKEVSEFSDITIDLEVEDDIELQEIVVLMDGEVVATFTEFTDYRIALKTVNVEGLAMGEHTVTVRATDMEGKETVKTTTFSKEPPYTPVFENEIFYMPFDKDFMELIGLQTPEQIGNPGFSDDAKEGTGAYKGAADSYLSIPLPELGDEFSIAFWYKLDPSVERAGILTATDDADLNQGFRLFRESQGNQDTQTIKLNMGIGEDTAWNDGGKISSVEPEWTHITFTVSPTGTAIYFNGVLERATVLNNVTIDWTGVENLVIGSGLNFNGWGHNSDPSLIDELRIFDAALTAEEVNTMVNPPSEDISLHLPFDGNFNEQVTGRSINVVGSPGFTEDAKVGSNAYAGAEGAYLTFPSQNLLSEEFSATFWYKVDSSPDRAGIISISAVNPDGANKNNLTKGFQLFREGSADSQRIKASIGTGASNSWNDGGLIDATAGEWVHIGFVITENKSRIYINGELATEAAVPGGVDWTGADLVSVMSGAPRFVEWNHLSDQSYIDDLRFYRVALTEEEIEADMNN
ncbi:LamG domain-containing protein [Salinimicrobium sp. TH3]|uniref:LamG domain-containing protein n=1 Tax=Salinimicrobium sp. TH3 TaxID=2997342 RepID=UPI0022758294|nr:LamG domain-containing protein [Salinimicrobium sp. TH3]MCY2686067.1 LamG domain-containing protein [Salinimicrobium sp. TH3]